MTKIDLLFIQIMKSALSDRSFELPAGIAIRDIEQLLQTADHHSVLPFVYEAIIQSLSDLSLHSDAIEKYRNDAVRSVMLQIEKTGRFLQLYRSLRSSGLCPLVVKGLFCRHLYKRPSYRASVDEDVLVSSGDFAQADRMLLSKGLQYMEDYRDVGSEYEILYVQSPEYYEIHKSLFDPDDQVLSCFNRYFKDAEKGSVSFKVDDVELQTLDYSRHMLYLILHVFKHFLFSGFGIRQICDITLLANQYGKDIDWEFVIGSCRELHAYDFMCAVFKISEHYLTLDRLGSGIPEEILDNEIDESTLLEDVMNAGIMGAGDINRLHSSNITLQAVRNRDSEPSDMKRGSSNTHTRHRIMKLKRLMAALFPSYALIKRRYAYLERFPFLLPLSWLQRMISYVKDIRKYKQDNPLKALEIGEARTEILRKYHII